MSWLIVPVTIILLRGALMVLILAGAEALWEDCLSARVRRALWILCIFLLMMPQPHTGFQPFSLDLSGFKEQVVSVADILPREIAFMVKDIKIAYKFRDYSQQVTGLAYQNYPYLLGLILAIVPALFMLSGSYLRCRKRIKSYQRVTDKRILDIWKKVANNSRRTPLLLDSGIQQHPPVLFGFFRQKLLLPVAGFSKYSDSELELLLTHEYIHYRSGDGIINILTLFLWPFCWYNPFFLAARKRLRINCELACDEKVLKRFPERTSEYGRLLLDFAGTAKPPEVTLAFSAYAGELRKRIIHITHITQRKKSSRPAVFALVLVIVAPFLLFSAVDNKKSKSTTPVITLRAAVNAESYILKIRSITPPVRLRFKAGAFENSLFIDSSPKNILLIFGEKISVPSSSAGTLLLRLPRELAPENNINSAEITLHNTPTLLYKTVSGKSLRVSLEKIR